MTWWQAVILGIVEGLTEYLPISSTGHLILAQRALGIAGGEAADAYAICIQAGAILAVLGLYRARVRAMLLGLLGRDPGGLRLLFHLALGVAPAVVVGLLLEQRVKAALFGLWPVVAAWFTGGLVILAVARSRQPVDSGDAGLPLEAMTWRIALLVGLAQCVAVWPGTSRSLVTILGGLFAGLTLPAAVELSFLLGAVTLTGAAGKDALEHGATILAELGWFSTLLGCAVAAAAAVVAVKWMVAYLRRHGLELFGWYRVGLAAVATGLLLAGVLASR